MSWANTAVVWMNDPKRQCVLIGPYGFAWWTGRKVSIAAFQKREKYPVAAYSLFTDWGSVLRYERDQAPTSTVHRFVKTGLLPS